MLAWVTVSWLTGNWIHSSAQKEKKFIEIHMASPKPTCMASWTSRSEELSRALVAYSKSELSMHMSKTAKSNIKTCRPRPRVGPVAGVGVPVQEHSAASGRHSVFPEELPH